MQDKIMRIGHIVMTVLLLALWGMLMVLSSTTIIETHLNYVCFGILLFVAVWIVLEKVIGYALEISKNKQKVFVILAMILLARMLLFS